MDRDRQRGAGLVLPQRQHAVTDVLASDFHHVASSLRGVEPERQCQPGFATDRMMRLERGDLVLVPGVDAVRLRHLGLEAECRVATHVLVAMHRWAKCRIALSQLRAACGAIRASMAVMYSGGS